MLPHQTMYQGCLPNASQTDEGHSAMVWRGSFLVLLAYRCQDALSAHEGAIPLERDHDRRLVVVMCSR